MTELKNCPFCGRDKPDSSDGIVFYFWCVRCRCEGPHTIISLEKAMEMWNERAGPDEP